MQSAECRALQTLVMSDSFLLVDGIFQVKSMSYTLFLRDVL